MKKSIVVLISLTLGFLSCDKASDESPVMSGKLDFSRPVAIGNSLTAGMVSAGWTYELLKNSYPGLIVKQVAGETAVGDGKNGEIFVVARIADPGIIQPTVVAQNTKVGTLANGADVFRYTVTSYSPALDKINPTNTGYAKAFNNLAVPGATAHDMDVEITGQTVTYPPSPLGNPLFGTVTRYKASPYDQALTLNPTVAFLWVGNNEILTGALSGATTPSFPLESTATATGYKGHHLKMVNGLTAAGAKVVTATLPNVTVIPAVSKVGIVSFQNNRAYIADLNGDKVYSDTLAFWGADNGVVRKLRGTERVLMRWLGKEPELNNGALYGLAEATPLADNEWLSDEEISTISNDVALYNEYIRSLDTRADVAVVDINALFTELVANDGKSYTMNGQTFTIDLSLPYGGFFSLDGVHPTEYGQKVIANAFIQKMNAKFGSEIPAISLVRPTMKSVPTGTGKPVGEPAGAVFEQMRKYLKF